MDKRSSQNKTKSSQTGQPRSSHCGQGAGVLLFCCSRMWNSSYWVFPFSPPSNKKVSLQRPCSLSFFMCWMCWNGRLAPCTMRGYIIQSWWEGQTSPEDTVLDAVTAEEICIPHFAEGVHMFYLCHPKAEINDPTLAPPFSRAPADRFNYLNISEIQLFSHCCHFLGSILSWWQQQPPNQFLISSCLLPITFSLKLWSYPSKRQIWICNKPLKTSPWFPTAFK